MDFGASSQLRFKRGAVAKEGDIVIVTGSRTHFQTLRLKQGAIYNCKYGHFAHNDMIGQSFGSWITAWKVHAQPTRAQKNKFKKSKKKTQAKPSSTSTADNGDREELKIDVKIADNDASSKSPAPSHSLSGHKRKQMDDDAVADEAHVSKAIANAIRRGEICMLRPTCELYTQSLLHRTQIIYDADKALIAFMLQLRSNDIVFESGTGSGSLSTSLSRVVSPHGHLFTFEFNEMRAEYARVDFQTLCVDSLITVVHRNIVQNGFPNKTQLMDTLRGLVQQATEATKMASELVEPAAPAETEKSKDKNKKNGTAYTDCLGQNAVLNKLAWLSEEKLQNLQNWLGKLENEHGDQFVNGVFLDLPKPWMAIPSAHAVLKENARICSFSPCIEQVQRTCVALAENGFVDIRTFEVLSRDHLIKENACVPLDLDETYGQHQKRASHWYKPKEVRAELLISEPKCWTSRPVAKTAGHTGYLTFALKSIESTTNV